jgi:hypothetical protein
VLLLVVLTVIVLVLLTFKYAAFCLPLLPKGNTVSSLFDQLSYIDVLIQRLVRLCEPWYALNKLMYLCNALVFVASECIVALAYLFGLQ